MSVWSTKRIRGEGAKALYLLDLVNGGQHIIPTQRAPMESSFTVPDNREQSRCAKPGELADSLLTPMMVDVRIRWIELNAAVNFPRAK
eukprot:285934-Prymnesium_polylepis.2